MGALYFTITKVFLQPLPLLLLLLAGAVADLWRRRKESRARLTFVTVPLLAMVAASTPAVVYPLVGTLEWGYPPLARRPTDTDAIVVLSGGILEADAVRLQPVLAEDTLYRCLHAAELYHQGNPCPVIVTGGTLDPNAAIPPVAPSMRALLVRLGVRRTDVIVEPDARTTYENATRTRKILVERKLKKVVLVTEAVHMPRSVKCFRNQGVEATAAPCHFRATHFPIEASTFVPSPEAIKSLVAVLHEWIGLGWYRITGKI